MLNKQQKNNMLAYHIAITSKFLITLWVKKLLTLEQDCFFF